MHNYLDELNEPQREAVSHINGPLMIIAGAGSGKTKVLTTRIAHLMANGVDAFNILCAHFYQQSGKRNEKAYERYWVVQKPEFIHLVRSTVCLRGF